MMAAGNYRKKVALSRLIPVSGNGIAKMDALIVKIDSIPKGYVPNRGLPP